MSEPTAYAGLWQVDQMACPLGAVERMEVVRELAARIAGAPGVLDPAALLRDLETREGESSTFLGHGLALPHARTTSVNRIVIAVGLSAVGVPWGPNGEEANFVFLVGVPRADVRGYLDLVSRLTKAARKSDWAERAAACPDTAALAAALRDTVGG